MKSTACIEYHWSAPLRFLLASGIVGQPPAVGEYCAVKDCWYSDHGVSLTIVSSANARRICLAWCEGR
ncbi:unnamed protein product [Lota lota]